MQETNLVTEVAILPIVDGWVGLIRIYRPAIRTYTWEISHGFVDEEESDHSSALRELLEKTELTVGSKGFFRWDILHQILEFWLQGCICFLPKLVI